MSQLSTFYSPLTAADLGLGNSANVTFGSVTTGAVTGSGNATFGSIQNTPIGNTTPNSGAFTTLSANNGTLTASAPVLDLSQTWNNGAVAFTGMRFNVTNTAAATASTIADFQVGGASVLTISRLGGLGNGGSGWLTFNSNFGSAALMSGVWYFNNQVAFGVAASLGTGSGAVQLSAAASIGWSSNTQPTLANADLRLWRDGADILAQHRTTNPQTFRLYNTFTNASNYERGFMRWSSNVLQIGTEAAGTGTLRGLNIGTATSSLLGFYGVTPVDQPATVADPAGGGTIDTEARTAIGEVIDRLQELGLIA